MGCNFQRAAEALRIAIDGLRLSARLIFHDRAGLELSTIAFGVAIFVLCYLALLDMIGVMRVASNRSLLLLDCG